MVARVFSLSAVAAAAMLASTASALDQKLHGLNYDMRQGADWASPKCKDDSAMAADLKVLSTVTSNVRIYSLSDCDATGVLTAAKDLGMTVWLGVWVSADESVYDAEVAAFKKLIKAGLIDDNVVGINVGSEAVYRKDITAKQAIQYVDDFQKVMKANDISVPVSITDIIDTFVQYPEMIKAGDIVTINQFPFWEKVEASKAAAQFNKRIQPLLELAGDMEVIISETGWPSGGSAKAGSEASAENAAIYLNDFYFLAKEKGWKYYYFAGLDTPYKEVQADDATTVESHFGLFDEDGNMKPEYKSLTFKQTATFSDSGSSDNSASSSTGTSSTGMSSTGASSTGAGTVAPGGSKTTSSSTGTSTTTSSSSSADTASSSSADTASSSSVSNEGGNGSAQLVAASFAACVGVVSTMLWSL